MTEHDEDVIQMNEVHCCASGWVQRRTTMVAAHDRRRARPSDRRPCDPERETTMLKTISAALLAVSVLAAPAMAAGVAKTAPATDRQDDRPRTAPRLRRPTGDQGGACQAERDERQCPHGPASLGIRHHRFHKHMGAYKAHQFSKVTSSTPRPPSSAADTDPRARPVPHCPAASADIRPGPHAIASPMAAGRCFLPGE